MHIKLHILRLEEASRSGTMDFTKLFTQDMGIYWDESHRMEGGHFLSGFTAQLVIAAERQQGWLNTPSKMALRESVFQ